MNSSFLRFAALLLGFAAFALPAGAAPKADLVSTETRSHVVELARQLAAPAPLAAMPAELSNPFAPAGFGQTAPSGPRPVAEAQPTSDGDLLALIASRIVPSGTLIFNGEPMLTFGKKRLRVGDHLTVSYDGKDYDLTIAAIGRTTFTLRLNREEIIRPI
jgi:hypothetical protein